jgi:RNA 2',3'-cyclic 3'-phosphodiesterase
MSDVAWRLFVAAPLPPAAADALWTALAEVRGRHADARWIPPDQLHLTLVFLGTTDAAEVPRLTAQIDRATQPVSAFTVSTGDGGGRPANHRSGVAWLRLAAGDRQVAALARAVDDALGSGAYAERQPMAHVTVARRVDRRLIDDLRAASSAIDVSWQVERVVLYRSHTGPAGARYEELASAGLGTSTWPRPGH